MVSSRSPLWDPPDRRSRVLGLRDDCHEVLVTHPFDAEPSHREELPEPSVWPLVVSLAVSVGFVGSIFSPWWIVIGAALAIPGSFFWYWPPHIEPAFVHRKKGT